MNLLFPVVTRYWHTIRHLRLIQIHNFVWNRILRCLPVGPSYVEGVSLSNCIKPPRLSFLPEQIRFHGTTFTFLNHSVEYPSGICWNDPRPEKLWRYHLHYMGFLHQIGVSSTEQREWIQSWIRGNPNPKSEGWEPFPTSIRLVNWLKVWWKNGGLEVGKQFVASAYAQARHLRRFVEYHIHANHLFENLKALFWAGCTFRGEEAEGWRIWAAQKLMHEIQEQVLSDGGHYERSPMYHAMILEGCLDLLNIQDVWSEQYPALAELLLSRSELMLHWLETMTHQDGEIALFNDAAFKNTSAPRLLLDYGRKLGLNWSPPKQLTYLEESGYVAIHKNGHYIVIDIGHIGPDHQSGHGHCDLMSFEWSWEGQRIICDSGVYSYQDQIMRPYVRSTAAHNTLQIDGQEQSEIWKEFRVASRAHPFSVSVKSLENGGVFVEAGHDGYRRLPGHPIHQRQFVYHDGRLSILDELTGRRVHKVEAFIRFHPAVIVKEASQKMFDLFLAEQRIGFIHFENWKEARLIQGWYCPEFGRREPNTVINFVSYVHLPFNGLIEIDIEQA